MSLKDRLIKNTTIKTTASLSNSELFGHKDQVSTPIPMLNVALSGDLAGGFYSGITAFAGESKRFKTGFALVCAKAFLDKYDDGVVMFYDSEFGAPPAYFKHFGIDPDRVIHIPITSVEELTYDFAKQLKGIEREDRVHVIIDSVGNLASVKEVEDAEEGNQKADMGRRAKQLKSFFRVIGPHLSIKDVPLHVINHTYKTMEMYSKDVVSGGTGMYYNADTIFIIGRQQDKEDKTAGFNFTIRVEKSRFIKEGSVIPIQIKWNEGINKYSGLLDQAVESGIVTRGGAWYTTEDGQKMQRKDMDDAFFEALLSNDEFCKSIRERYCIST